MHLGSSRATRNNLSPVPGVCWLLSPSHPSVSHPSLLRTWFLSKHLVCRSRGEGKPGVVGTRPGYGTLPSCQGHAGLHGPEAGHAPCCFHNKIIGDRSASANFLWSLVEPSLLRHARCQLGTRLFYICPKMRKVTSNESRL